MHINNLFETDYGSRCYWFIPCMQCVCMHIYTTHVPLLPNESQPLYLPAECCYIFFLLFWRLFSQINFYWLLLFWFLEWFLWVREEYEFFIFSLELSKVNRYFFWMPSKTTQAPWATCARWKNTSDVQRELPVFWVVSSPVTGHLWKDPGSVLFAPFADTVANVIRTSFTFYLKDAPC